MIKYYLLLLTIGITIQASIVETLEKTIKNSNLNIVSLLSKNNSLEKESKARLLDLAQTVINERQSDLSSTKTRHRFSLGHDSAELFIILSAIHRDIWFTSAASAFIFYLIYQRYQDQKMFEKKIDEKKKLYDDAVSIKQLLYQFKICEDPLTRQI